MATVSAHIYDTWSGKSLELPVRAENGQYLPRLGWNKHSGELYLFRMNRQQNSLELWLADPTNGRVEKMLEEAPGLEAKALFEWLQEQKPGKYEEGQLRTFQRRVSRRNALQGQQLLSLEQVHQAGEVLQTDGT